MCDSAREGACVCVCLCVCVCVSVPPWFGVSAHKEDGGGLRV